RDKIPEIIKSKGDDFKVHIANKKEYWNKLKEKLQEEVNEFIEDENKEELADILEVIEAICGFKEWKEKDIQEIKDSKKEKRGGFNKRIILDES
ncbi:MAG: nucleoside triphosphate pyrophosphohydrolase, partial [Candidatus Paceibacterota bacterium]